MSSEKVDMLQLPCAINDHRDVDGPSERVRGESSSIQIPSREVNEGAMNRLGEACFESENANVCLLMCQMINTLTKENQRGYQIKGNDGAQKVSPRVW